MIYLELKKKALAIIFSQVKIIRSGEVIRLVDSSKACIPDTQPIDVAEIIRALESSGGWASFSLSMDSDLIIRELNKADGVVAPKIKTIEVEVTIRSIARNGTLIISLVPAGAKDFAHEKSQSSGTVAVAKSLRSGEIARDASIILVDEIHTLAIQGEDVVSLKAIATTTNTSVLAMISDDTVRCFGVAESELIDTATISTATSISEQSRASATAETVVALNIWSKDIVREKSATAFDNQIVGLISTQDNPTERSISAAGIMLKIYKISDYFENTIENLFDKKISELF